MFYADPKFYIYLLTLLPFALCSWFYGVRSPWRGTPTGRAVFMLLASLTSVLFFTVLVQITGIPEWLRAWLRVLTLGTVQVAGWWLFLDIRRLQRDAPVSVKPREPRP